MKHKLLFFIVGLLAFFSIAATTPTVTTTLTMIGTNPTFNADGSLASASIQAMFRETVTIDDRSFDSPVNILWDGTDKTKTVTVDGVTLTYAQVTAFAAAIAYQEKAAQAQAK